MMRVGEPFAPGHRFVKYDIRGLLGSGGLAYVYDAHDPFLDRDVAVKVISPPKEARRAVAQRAQSEARLLVRIDHPNVVKVYDAGATGDGLVYLVMEKLEGRSLREVFRDLGRLSVGEALEVAKQTCAGVHAAHELGVIHRDLKPENLFVQSGNRIKVLDVGVSHIIGGAPSGGHVLHGSVLYMSPEHLQGYGVTRRSDVFALGTLLYEGLYSHPALLWPEVRHASDIREVIRVQLSETPPMLHELDSRIFRHVARFVHRAVLKHAEQRYASMADMLEAALAAGQRIQLEQGNEYLMRGQRDLSRASSTARGDSDRDAPRAHTRGPTRAEPRQPSRPGGRAAPGSPRRVAAFADPSAVSRAATRRPRLHDDDRVNGEYSAVVPSLAEARHPADVPPSDPWPLPTTARRGYTPAQSKTLALAEQETQTDELEVAAVSPVPGTTLSREEDPEGASVAPVAHSSVDAADFSGAGRIRALLGRRWSVRVVVVAGAVVGLSLGVVYSVSGQRGPAAGSELEAATTPARRVPAAAPHTTGPRPAREFVPGRGELGGSVGPDGGSLVPLTSDSRSAASEKPRMPRGAASHPQQPGSEPAPASSDAVDSRGSVVRWKPEAGR